MLLNAFQRFCRYEPLYLVGLPFLGWVLCFWKFIFGQLPLTADAVSYFQHIGFFTDHLARGVYPLWDPFWFDGAPYHFFLRRIGDVNPLLWMIVLMKWAGISHHASYMIFLLVNYFLVMLAFYLIARMMMKDRLYAFLAYVLLMFSSWGNQLFYNYIILIFLPIIWFFYFLLSFYRDQKKCSFLGMCLCAGIILTTYIPFYFIIILGVFMLASLVFYGRQVMEFIKRLWVFVGSRRFFVSACACFLLLSCVPAVILYQESKEGAFVLPSRYGDAKESSAVAVGIDNVANGDIINNGSFDKVFSNTSLLSMGDFYIPYFFFVLLLCGLAGTLTKRICFLFAILVLLAAITTTNAVGIHQFLYKHVFIFKFIRNIYYFFWLAILPVAVLMIVDAFRSMLQTASASSFKKGWLAYILSCHAALIFFICVQGGFNWAVLTGLVLSAVFCCYVLRHEKASWVLIVVAFMAVALQSAQVYGYLDRRFKEKGLTGYVQYDYRTFSYVRPETAAGEIVRPEIYYSTGHYAQLSRQLDPVVFNQYLRYRLRWVDNVIDYKDHPIYLKKLEEAMSAQLNVAYVTPTKEAADVYAVSPGAPLKADLVVNATDQLKVSHFSANALDISVRLDKRRFLVINDNYHEGWKVWVNSKQTPVLRTNGAFKGLWVPAGDSVIRLRFLEPLRYMFHLGLMAVFMGVFIYWIFLMCRQKDKGEH